MQPGRLALFGVKLRGNQVVAPQHRSELHAVINGRQEVLRLKRAKVVGVDKVGVNTAAQASQYRVRLARRRELQLVPAHVRDLQRRVRGLQPLLLSRDPAQALMKTVLQSSFGQELHADTDAKKGPPLLDH